MGFMGFTILELKTYLLLTLCWVSIIQVNLLEQPYARSLVVCDTPTNTTAGAEFSGSKYCGDRLHVINVGASISGWGQSLENVGRMVACFFVSGFADRGGRRPSAILGHSMLLFSTMLFFFAGLCPIALSIPIYTIAQGIQGMSGFGILDQIITGDVALLLKDEVGVLNRKNTLLAVCALIFMPVILYVQYAEFNDFTWVWIGINALNTVVLLLLMAFFPETMPSDKKPEEGSLMSMAVKELQKYRDLVSLCPLVKYRLIEMFLMGVADASSVSNAFLMANFGMGQFEALALSSIPGLVLAAVCMPLVPYLHRRWGYRYGWNFCFWTMQSMCVFFCFGIPGLQHPLLRRWFGVLPGPIFGLLAGVPLCGFGTVVSAVELRVVGQESNPKYQAMTQLMGFVTGAANSVLYPAVFDAEATTDFGKLKVHYVSALLTLIQIPGFLFLWGPIQKAECDKMTAEEAAQAAAKAKGADADGKGEADGQAAGDKKTD